MAYNLKFEKDIGDTIKKYPFLKITRDDKESYLKGILDINDNKKYLGSYSIEIKGSRKYPYEFPITYEVGGDIPAEPDFHKYNDNSLCIDIRASEILKCHSGMTVSTYIETELIPYFANQIYRKLTGHYVNEYKHGRDGIRQFYCRLFSTNDIRLWKKCVQHAFSHIDKERNELCYCGSGLKYKKCHLLTDEKLILIGKEQILNDLLIL